jgi:hypothetical protein
LQVLLVFFGEMRSAGLPTRLTKPSIEMLSALEDLGFKTYANEWLGESVK